MAKNENNNSFYTTSVELPIRSRWYSRMTAQKPWKKKFYDLFAMKGLQTPELVI